MGFDLDTSDMDRQAVELRLYMARQRRRFTKAQMNDVYERIVKNSLTPDEEAGKSDNSAIQIEHISAQEANRLRDFLDNLIGKCFRSDQHEALQRALRDSLLQSRRRSIMSNDGNNAEPICYFCAGGIHSQDDGTCKVAGQIECTRLPQDQPAAVTGPPIVANTVTRGDANKEHPSIGLINLYPISPPFSISAPTPDVILPSPPNGQPANESSPSEAGKTPPSHTALPLEPAPNDRPSTNGKTNGKLDADSKLSESSSSSSDSSSSDGDDEQMDVDADLNGDAHEDSMHQWFVDQNEADQPQPPRASTPLAETTAIRDPEKPLALVIRRTSLSSNSKQIFRSSLRSPAITIESANNRRVTSTSTLLAQADNTNTNLHTSRNKALQDLRSTRSNNPNSRTKAETRNQISSKTTNRSSNASDNVIKSSAGPRTKTTPHRAGSEKRNRLA